MEYLIKVSAIIAIFYFCYNLFLQRDTFFESNRWFLLIGLITAFCIPFIVIPKYIIRASAPIQDYIFVEGSTSSNVANSTFDFIQIISVIYIIGLIFFFGRFIIQLYSLSLLLIKSKKQQYKHYTFVEAIKDVSPFSFFKWIVYNPNQFSKTELKQILTHEKVHVTQWHSIDILISQITSIILWFNPLIWLYKNNLQQNLEFIADQNANKKTDCKKSYQHLLLKASLPNYQMALTNNFYNSLIKKRIVMLHKNRSKNRNHWKFALILPLLALFIMSFNTKEIYIEKESTEKISIPEITAIETLEVIISKDSKEADFELIKSDFKKAGVTLKFSNIKRNENDEIIAIKIEAISGSSNANFNTNSDDAIKPIKIIVDDETNNISIGNGIERNLINGEVYSFTSKDGSSKVHTSGKRERIYLFESDDEDKGNLDSIVFTKRESKEHMVHRLQKGKSFLVIPGDDSYKFEADTIHVVLKDKSSNNSKGYTYLKGNAKIWANDKNKFSIRNSKDKQPIFILDGKEIPKFDIKAIEPNNIKSINVLKGEAAIKLYGKKGKDGVIEINTKKEVGEKSKWSYEISKVQFIDDEDGSKDGTVFYISKNTSKQLMNSYKSDLKELNINVKYSKIKRNKAGEITSIKVSLNNNSGKKVSSTFQDNDGIATIAFGTVEGGKLVVLSSDSRY